MADTKKNGPKSLRKSDPILTAIAEAKTAYKHWSRLCDALDRAEYKARRKYGDKPFTLISWRNYSAIGGSEIERARDEFMRLPGADPSKIEKEYHEAKARERAAERAKIAWFKRAGLTRIRREYSTAFEASKFTMLEMARTAPTTPAGAVALLMYVKDDLESGEDDWHMIALDTLVASSPIWTQQAK